MATFEKARLEFSKGLNIMSGMSGAGKSVLLKALDLALGGRFSQKLIQESAEQAEVIAFFQLNDQLQKYWKDEIQLSSDECIIRRVFKKEGRSLNYVNDRLVSSDLLNRLGADLAKTLNQDEAFGLKDTSYQLKLLDNYAGLEKKQEAFLEQYQMLKKIDREILTQEEAQKNWSQQRQFLEFQYQELSKIKLEKGEFAILEEESKRLSHSNELSEACEALAQIADEYQSRLPAHLQTLKSFCDAQSPLGQLAKEGEELQFSSEEWVRVLKSEKDVMETNPYRLEEVDTRLRTLRGAFKKFNMDETALIEHFESIEKQLDGGSPESKVEKLKKERKALFKKASDLSKKLHQQRQKKSKEISKEINRMLDRLEMPGERFSIDLQYDESKINAQGATQLEFLLKATADSPAKPLHECASGGERSRALLAICSALSKTMGQSLLVFDEIDTNIGSRLGKAISEAFLTLSKKAQVICVTHLAPVAACGEKHFLIEKGSTASTVQELTDQERVSELAQMIAGEKDSASALKQAEHMLKQYRKIV